MRMSHIAKENEFIIMATKENDLNYGHKQHKLILILILKSFSCTHTPGRQRSFGVWRVRTFNRACFNPSDLSFGVLETDAQAFIQAAYYQGHKLEFDESTSSTTGLGRLAAVGWFNVQRFEQDCVVRDCALSK